jgi:hypothetical protein
MNNQRYTQEHHKAWNEATQQLQTKRKWYHKFFTNETAERELLFDIAFSKGYGAGLQEAVTILKGDDK